MFEYYGWISIQSQKDDESFNKFLDKLNKFIDENFDEVDKQGFRIVESLYGMHLIQLGALKNHGTPFPEELLKFVKDNWDEAYGVLYSHNSENNSKDEFQVIKLKDKELKHSSEFLN